MYEHWEGLHPSALKKPLARTRRVATYALYSAKVWGTSVPLNLATPAHHRHCCVCAIKGCIHVSFLLISSNFFSFLLISSHSFSFLSLSLSLYLLSLSVSLPLSLISSIHTAGGLGLCLGC